jgi:hypothetical protein
VIPRPHGAWEIIEPDGDGCLDGDYLTSRGQYLEAPSSDPADSPLAIVQADENVDDIAVELVIEIEPRDLIFHRIKTEGGTKPLKPWFKRERINVELIARRLIELTHMRSENVSDATVKLGKAVLRGKRRESSGR